MIYTTNRVSSSVNTLKDEESILLKMRGNSQHIKVDKDVIELYDIVESDLKIEECYGYANEILFKEKILKAPPFRKREELERMRITTLNSR